MAKGNYREVVLYQQVSWYKSPFRDVDLDLLASTSAHVVCDLISVVKKPLPDPSPPACPSCRGSTHGTLDGSLAAYIRPNDQANLLREAIFFFPTSHRACSDSHISPSVRPFHEKVHSSPAHHNPALDNTVTRDPIHIPDTAHPHHLHRSSVTLAHHHPCNTQYNLATTPHPPYAPVGS